MFSVNKYQITAPRKPNAIRMPKGARPLHVEVIDGNLYLWAHVLSDGPTEVRYFFSTGTGEEVPDDPDHYIGSAINGKVLWHVFEVK